MGCVRFGKYLHMLLLMPYPPPLQNVPAITVSGNAFAILAMQVFSLFYLSISHTQCFVDLNKARLLPPSHASCTNLSLLDLDSTEHKTRRDQVEKSTSITLFEDWSPNLLAIQFEMLEWPPRWMMGGNSTSGAMMPPWWHAYMRAPWYGLSL